MEKIFRLRNSPQGTLLIKFYYLDLLAADSVNMRLAQQLLAGRIPGSTTHNVLFDGLVERNTILPETIAKLHQQCPKLNCVEIEKL